MLRQLLRTGGAGALVGLCGSRVVRLAYKGQRRMDREEADKVRRELGGKKQVDKDEAVGVFGAIALLAVVGLFCVAFGSDKKQDEKKSDRK